jgi:Protein of unknown function (DUF2946)
MDPIVIQALAKWPNVPHCYGWLGLDARGNWYMRDDRTQAAGPFSASAGGTLRSKGSLLQHEKLIEFIQRNYACDERGQWFFQNGPQRVYVELEAAPWVWRLALNEVGEVTTTAHDGRAANVKRCILDELGRVYLDTDIGLGLVYTQDVGMAATALELGQWQSEEMSATKIAVNYGFELSPSSKNQ